MEPVLQWVLTLVTIAISLMGSGLVVAYAMGKWRQALENLQDRQDSEEGTRKNNNTSVQRWQEKMEHKQSTQRHVMLEACTTQFAEINSKLGTLDGKVDILIRLKSKS